MAVLQRASVYVERTFRFLAVVVEEAPERPDGSSMTFIQDLIADILKLATAQEKIVRIRACSLLSNFMLRLRIEVDDETLDDVQQTMLDRLKDKVESNLSAINSKGHVDIQELRTGMGLHLHRPWILIVFIPAH